ncbi:glycosyl hydrolase, partial [Burkholderia gladioli]
MQVRLWSAAAVAAFAFAGAHAAGAPDIINFPPTPSSLDVVGSIAAQIRADALLRKMTLDEKLQLIHSQYEMSAVPGGGAGYIQGVPRLGIPDLNMADSSTGSGSTSQPSTTFPATIAVAASWDRQLSNAYGRQVA